MIILTIYFNKMLSINLGEIFFIINIFIDFHFLKMDVIFIINNTELRSYYKKFFTNISL